MAWRRALLALLCAVCCALAADHGHDASGSATSGQLGSRPCASGSAQWRRHSHAALQAEAAQQQAAGGAAAAAAAGSPTAAAERCKALSKDLLQSRAKNNTVMFAVMNTQQWDFAQNWLVHIKEVGIDYYLLAATDVETSERLTAMGEPCFDRIDEGVRMMGLEWGQEGWRRMTWAKVFVLDEIVDWGFNVIISDVDVVWFKDPMPLLDRHPAVDLLFSEDGVQSVNNPGDDGLEVQGSPHSNFNTGVYLLRYSNRTAAWVHAWRKYFDQCRGHDQECAYAMMRTNDMQAHPDVPRVWTAWHNSVYIGILPPSMAMNAHTLFLQELHKVKKVDPYVVHLTWTYNGTPGKRSRLRDMGLWVDPPEYYANGSFVTVDLQVPEPPSHFNDWNENEDMVVFYLDTIHKQLQQAYVGMALAVSASRAFILPNFQCYCEKIWYAVVRCRVVDAQRMPLPILCPQDYLFQPGHYEDDPEVNGTPLQIRESTFLKNKRTPVEVKDSVLIIQPSATLECTDCVKEQQGKNGTTVVLVPPYLKDSQLLPLLDKYKQYRVWRLSFDGVGSTRRAYAGFSDLTAAAKFDRRIEYIPTNFCCRREEEAPRYHKEKEMDIQLKMTSEFKFSSPA